MRRLRYHQAVFDRLGITPVRSVGLRRVVGRRERACGVRFPASIVEWFSLEGVQRLYHDHSDCDHLTAAENLGRYGETRYGFLEVVTENQSCCYWYAHLDGSDDPPVFLTDSAPYEDLRKAEWRAVQADTFSGFVNLMTTWRGNPSPLQLLANDRMPTRAAIRRLRAAFREAPRSRAPVRVVPKGRMPWWARWRVAYQFFDHDGSVGILTRTDDRDPGGAKWHVCAMSPDSLYEFGRVVRGCLARPESLKPGHPLTEERQVVRRLNAEAGMGSERRGRRLSRRT